VAEVRGAPDPPAKKETAGGEMNADAPRQGELILPQHRTDDLLRESLAAHVETFNSSTDPIERTEAHRAIQRIRSILERGGQ
jgi:hypothetical protein